MTASGGLSIWALLEEAARTLPEPFRAARLITYVSERRPDVAEASIRTHINYALVESSRTGPWASRTPFLQRVDRGVYRRLRGREVDAPDSPPKGSATSAPVARPPASPGTSVDHLCSAFERRLRTDLDQIVSTGYRPTIYQRMLAENGAVGTALRLLAAPRISDGFRHLWEHQLLNLTVEHAVADPAFASLFTGAERDIAAQRLRDAGWRGRSS